MHLDKQPQDALLHVQIHISLSRAKTNKVSHPQKLKTRIFALPCDKQPHASLRLEPSNPVLLPAHGFEHQSVQLQSTHLISAPACRPSTPGATSTHFTDAHHSTGALQCPAHKWTTRPRPCEDLVPRPNSPSRGQTTVSPSPYALHTNSNKAPPPLTRFSTGVLDRNPPGAATQDCRVHPRSRFRRPASARCLNCCDMAFNALCRLGILGSAAACSAACSRSSCVMLMLQNLGPAHAAEVGRLHLCHVWSNQTLPLFLATALVLCIKS